MNYFKWAVYGLWIWFFYFVLVFLGETFFSGTLKDTAFTNLGIIIMLVVIVLDTILSFGSIEEV